MTKEDALQVAHRLIARDGAIRGAGKSPPSGADPSKPVLSLDRAAGQAPDRQQLVVGPENGPNGLSASLGPVSQAGRTCLRTGCGEFATPQPCSPRLPDIGPWSIMSCVASLASVALFSHGNRSVRNNCFRVSY
jgi:hypothetical protein